MADPIPITKQVVMDANDARLAFHKVGADWVKFMDGNRLRSGSFRINTVGDLHGVNTAFEVGCHADAFDELGWNVVSHAVVLTKTPSGDVTVTSLLVRKRAAN